MNFLSKRLGTITLLMALSIKIFYGALPQGQVLGIASAEEQPFETPATSKLQTVVKTQTAFDQKEITEEEQIQYDTKYEKDPESEYGTEKVKQPGEYGRKIHHYLLTYWQEETIDKQLIKTDTTPPVDEIIVKGTKIIWRMLEGTEYGRIKYWRKMHVWATKYDANCIGCTGRTYSGTQVKQGVCATDPKVIPLGTNFYVKGYGLCRAEDIGGAIKGNKIDLGFVDASKGNWGAAYTDIYLLTNAPE
jgi:3D (Asp-Asp-Asp) domain-containing protein